MTTAAKGSDAMHDLIGTAAVGARSRPAGATGLRRAGTAFLGGLWAARAVRGWLALILLSGALALPALPVHADATDDLFEAVQYGTPSEVKALIEGGADPAARTEIGATPLHIAVMFNSNPSVIKALIEGGADPGAPGGGGTTPLHGAAMFNSNPSVIKALIEAGANPGARDDAGKVPFDYAKENEALKGTDAYWLLSDGRFE